MSISTLPQKDSFAVYTFRNADSIQVEKKAEAKFITPYNRTFDDYINTLDDHLPTSLKLKNYVLSRMINLDSKIYSCEFSYLDCGGGNGTAIDTFIERFNHFVGITLKCHGISLHLFNNVKNLLNKNPNVLTWFHGYALQVLKKMPSSSYDLITDVWGAYFYSPNFAEILQEYHRVLKPGGKCYIKTHNDKVSAIGKEKLTPLRFELFLQGQAPDSFTLSEDIGSYISRSFLMEKRTQRWPIAVSIVIKSKSFSYARKKKKRSHQEMLDGCAIHPNEIRFETVPNKKPNLRQLPIAGL